LIIDDLVDYGNRVTSESGTLCQLMIMSMIPATDDHAKEWITSEWHVKGSIMMHHL